jgi:hypothetical protein
MIDIRIEGLEQLRRDLQDFSERRLRAAVATGLTRTGVQVKAKVTQTMQQALDRPTPYTQRALFLEPAKADTLNARVWFKDDRAGTGTPATKYLLPQVMGGPRNQKRFEKAFKAAGLLPAPYDAITPGPGARIDGYGNWERGQLSAVLRQLVAQGASSQPLSKKQRSAAISTQRRQGGGYFIVPRPGQGKLAPGIYIRDFVGRTITPMAFFVKGVDYDKRFDFYGVAGQVVQARLQDEVARAIGEQAARLAAARGGRP